MANTNAVLGAAAKAKKDEFYTQLSDIEKELRHYSRHFKGKTVLCNCDDPFRSNFFKYFVMHFNQLGLKKLTATCYAGVPGAKRQLSFFDAPDSSGCRRNKACKAAVTAVCGSFMPDAGGLFKSEGNLLAELQGDGDFRSEECLALLDEADIVVTNPPFSLFREYVAVLMEHRKKFIIIGHQNAISCKDIFPLLKDGRIWLGYGFPGNIAYFESPYEDTAAAPQHKEGLIRISGVMWYTNLDFEKRHEKMLLVKKYSPSDYPRYDNYDAIEVSRAADIPRDYAGEMGVPITFLGKYSPDQFEIIAADFDAAGPVTVNGRHIPAPQRFYVGGVRKYARILIRSRHPAAG